jgi:hypothetical protein
MKFRTKTIISAGNVAGNLASSTIDLRYNYGVAVQCSLTGVPSGDVLLQGTNDDPSAVASPNWTTVDTSTISGTTLISFNKDGLYWPWLRVYKAAGGTGTLTATVTVKGA